MCRFQRPAADPRGILDQRPVFSLPAASCFCRQPRIGGAANAQAIATSPTPSSTGCRRQHEVPTGRPRAPRNTVPDNGSIFSNSAQVLDAPARQRRRQQSPSCYGPPVAGRGLRLCAHTYQARTDYLAHCVFNFPLSLRRKPAAASASGRTVLPRHRISLSFGFGRETQLLQRQRHALHLPGARKAPTRHGATAGSRRTSRISIMPTKLVRHRRPPSLSAARRFANQTSRSQRRHHATGIPTGHAVLAARRPNPLLVTGYARPASACRHREPGRHRLSCLGREHDRFFDVI